MFAVHAGSLPGPGKVGPVCDHVPGQVSVSGEVDQRGGEGFTKQVLQVLSVLSLHPAGESRDTSLHVEQVGVGTGSTKGQTTGNKLNSNTVPSSLRICNKVKTATTPSLFRV